MEIVDLATPQHGYNGALLPINGKYLFFFRHEKHISHSPHYISCCWLDLNFNVISHYFRFRIRGYDPRPIIFQNKVYFSYTDHYRVHFCQLYFIPFLNIPIITKKIKINQADFPLNENEKNWLPFVYQNRLLCIYSFAPYKIIEINLATATASSYTSADTNFSWNFGKIFGGSVPIDYTASEKITFFHSWTADSPDFRQHPRTYYIGAYTFSPQPPFNIQRITKIPLDLPEFHQSPVGFIHYALFPTTAIKKSKNLELVYGEHDYTTKILKIPISYLEKLLTRFP